MVPMFLNIHCSYYRRFASTLKIDTYGDTTTKNSSSKSPMRVYPSVIPYLPFPSTAKKERTALYIEQQAMMGYGLLHELYPNLPFNLYLC